MGWVYLFFAEIMAITGISGIYVMVIALLLLCVAPACMRFKPLPTNISLVAGGILLLMGMLMLMSSTFVRTVDDVEKIKKERCAENKASNELKRYFISKYLQDGDDCNNR